MLVYFTFHLNLITLICGTGYNNCWVSTVVPAPVNQKCWWRTVTVQISFSVVVADSTQTRAVLRRRRRQVVLKHDQRDVAVVGHVVR